MADLNTNDEQLHRYGELMNWLTEREATIRKQVAMGSESSRKRMEHVVHELLVSYCAAKQLVPLEFDEHLVRRLEDRFRADARRLRPWGFSGIWGELDLLLDEENTRKAVRERKQELGSVLESAEGKIEPLPSTTNPFARAPETLASEFGNLDRVKLDGLY